MPAKSCDVPENVKLVAVEHPGIVKNIEQALESLGGDKRIGDFLHSKDKEKRLGFRFRPEDAFRPPIESRRTSSSSGVIVKVTVPKPTGRRRKKGSNDPFEHYETTPSSSSPAPVEERINSIRRAIRDNPDKVSIESLGNVAQTFRFRDLPDLQFSMADNKMVNNLRENLTSTDYPRIKDIQLDLLGKADGVPGPNIPPPVMMDYKTPWVYNYLQSLAVKTETDAEGNRLTTYTQSKNRVLTAHVKWDITEIPNAPSPDLEPEDRLPAETKKCIAEIERALDIRPIITRRVMHNLLPDTNIYDMKTAIQYRAYIMTSGPWKDCIVKFGVDPRSDPKYMRLQALTFQLTLRNKSIGTPSAKAGGKYVRLHRKAEDRLDSHLFDGTSLLSDGKLWQICDITNPLLAKILDVPPTKECERKLTGWLPNGTWAKARIIMRHMMTALMCDAQPQLDDYTRLLELADHYDQSSIGSCFVTGGSKLESELCTEVRSLIRSTFPTARGIAGGGKSIAKGDEDGEEEKNEDGEAGSGDGDGMSDDSGFN